MAGTQSNWDAVEGVAALVFDGASPTLNGGVSVVTVSLRWNLCSCCSYSAETSPDWDFTGRFTGEICPLPGFHRV